MSEMKDLQKHAKRFTLLYAEDNEALRLNATKLFKKFFPVVHSVNNGQKAWNAFREHPVSLVITDIKMPGMDGLELARNIRRSSPHTKIIVMSAFDEKDFLQECIRIGIFRFLKKPVSVNELADELLEAIHALEHENHVKLFHMHLTSIFNYQSSMVLMLNDSEPILANKMFLDFFDSKSIEEFVSTSSDFGIYFLPHDGFLSNETSTDPIETLKEGNKKLFHVKLKNAQGELRHFMLKYQLVPEKEGYGVLSFDDITELNLLKLFDEKENKKDIKHQDTQEMFNLLEVIQRNSAKVELHNYYKGLSITNDAVIIDTDDKKLLVKTNYLQEKAIQFEKKTLIVSDALPHPIECTNVLKIGFDNQVVELKSLRFVQTSPVTRSTIRVVPDEKQTVSLFLGQSKFQGDVSIEDISLNAVKLKLNALPAGLDKGDSVNLDIVLEMDKKPLIINAKATLFSKSELKHSFMLVFIFENPKISELLKYITSRQMEIIREFKGLQNG